MILSFILSFVRLNPLATTERSGVAGRYVHHNFHNSSYLPLRVSLIRWFGGYSLRQEVKSIDHEDPLFAGSTEIEIDLSIQTVG